LVVDLCTPDDTPPSVDFAVLHSTPMQDWYPCITPGGSLEDPGLTPVVEEWEFQEEQQPEASSQVTPGNPLRELTAEEQDWLFQNCLNQLHYLQEEARMRQAPTELKYL
jgi:hypothetical protein